MFKVTRANSGFAPQRTFDSLVRSVSKTTQGRVSMAKGDGWRSTQTASPFYAAAKGVFIKRRGARTEDAGEGWNGGVHSDFFLLLNPLTGRFEPRDPPAATNMAVRGAVAAFVPASQPHASRALLNRKTRALDQQEAAATRRWLFKS